MTPTTAAHLAESVVADGFTAHPTALAAFLGAAERRGANPVLLAVAGDATEPEVARLRAFGRLVVEYSTTTSRTGSVGDDPRLRALPRVPCGASAA